MKSYLWAITALGTVLGTMGMAANVQALEYKPFVEISSFSHSEAIAVHAILNDWNAPFSKGEIAFSINRAEIGIAVNNWQFSVFERQDYLFEFSPSTAKLLHATNTKQDLVVGEQYALQLQTNAFVAQGVKLGYQTQINHFKTPFNVGVALSYLEGLELTDGKLTGQATAVANNDYNFNFDVDYVYSQDSLFDRTLTNNVKGNGYALDLNLDGYLTPQWHANVQVRDVLAHINWWDAPRTVATGSSQTKEFDADGFVKFKPVASGTQSYKDVTQVIPTKVFLHNTYVLNGQHSLLFNYDDYAIKAFYTAGYQFINPQQHKMAVLYNATAQAWQLGYQTTWLKVELVSDALNLEEAKTLGLNVALKATF
ncbi:hypothetical protein [Thiomicrorhabdus aquaedulcis]|uniref:hypothetical protein n=1 Tax=Thiomicrorhabdus aquaedulcis TaxID=2211106 RepID=UPI000FDAC36B|nr:hypothetical protein [Thiomicrorhabdus aquaedulcis]